MHKPKPALTVGEASHAKIAWFEDGDRLRSLSDGFQRTSNPVHGMDRGWRRLHEIAETRKPFAVSVMDTGKDIFGQHSPWVLGTPNQKLKWLGR